MRSLMISRGTLYDVLPFSILPVGVVAHLKTNKIKFFPMLSFMIFITFYKNMSQTLPTVSDLRPKLFALLGAWVRRRMDAGEAMEKKKGKKKCDALWQESNSYVPSPGTLRSFLATTVNQVHKHTQNRLIPFCCKPYSFGLYTLSYASVLSRRG